MNYKGVEKMENINRVALLAKACGMCRANSEEQAKLDTVIFNMAQTAYQLGRADAVAEMEQKKQ